MKLTKYQELFVNQDSLLKNHELNVLSGHARFSGGINFQKLERSLKRYLSGSIWPYLCYNKSERAFKRKKSLNGSVIFSFRKPKVNLEASLWEIQLFTNRENVDLYIHMHHALADAHSFSLFWSDLHRAYAYDDYSEQVNYSLNYSGYRKEKQVSHTARINRSSLGPIKRIKSRINQTNNARLLRKARGEGVSLLSVIIYNFIHQLRHLTEESGIDIKPGLALRNRPTAMARQSFFSHVNFLPLENEAISSLKHTQAEIKRLFRNQGIPLLDLLSSQEAGVAFNVLISYQKENFNHDWGRGTNVNVEFLASAVDENVLSLHIIEYGDNSLKFFFDCRTDLIHEIAWRSVITRFFQKLSHWLDDKTPENTRQKGQYEFTQKKPESPTALFEHFFAASGEKPAIIFNNRVIDFNELRDRVVQTAKQYKQGQIVNINPRRDEAIVIEILGCWYSYAISVVSKKVTESLVLNEENPTLYIATTSGTTGLAKEVMIRRKGIELLMSSWRRIYDCDESVHISIADTRFDVFYADICRSILLGNTLVMPNDSDRLNPVQVAELIKRYSVTHLEITPSIALLFEEKLYECDTVKCFILGSEKLNVSLSKQIFKKKPRNATMYNSYGLTEVSIDSSTYQITGDEEDYIPCGKPMGNQCFRILGKDGSPIRPGVWGELEISGDAVGDLHLGNNEVKQLSSMLTGDTGMYLPREGLVIKGRTSEEIVKINGRRVPFLRIESLLKEYLHDDRIKCAAINSAFILFISDEKIKPLIYSFLKKNFLPHEQPNQIFAVTQWSINQNGKVDTNSLVQQFENIPVEELKKWTPDASEEEQLFAQFAKKENLNITNSTESLILRGWNSLHLIRLANYFRNEGYFLDIPKLMTQPSIEGIFASLRKLQLEAEAQPESMKLPNESIEKILSIINR